MIQRITSSRGFKWWNFWTIATGTFFSVVDHGSVLIALPGIESHFDATLESVQWVVVAYALVISVLLLPMGRLGDVIGRRQVYILGTAIFVAGSLGATFSPSLGVLIAMRVLQGIGAGMVQGCGMGMMLASFPDSERGKALGTHLSVVGLGAIAGPAMGGFLVAWFGWQSVFFVNVPAGCLVLVLSWLLLERGAGAGEYRQGRNDAFDWTGAAVSGAILLVLLVVVGNGNGLGWRSAPVIVGGSAVVLLMAVFVWWELRVRAPMLDLRLFANRIFGIGAAAAWLSFFGSSAARFMMPFYLQRVLGYQPEQVGLMMIPAALCMVILGPLSGRLSDRIGWQALTVGGLALTAAGAFVLAFALQERSPVWFVIATMMMQSSGTGLFNSPNSSSIISVVDRSRYGVVSALTQLIRNSANVVSVAVATTIVVSTMATYGVEPKLEAVNPEVATAFVAGLRWAFLAMGCALATGVAISIYRAIGNRRPAIPPQSGDVPATTGASDN
ncbi:MAG: MFS transporter [Chloroflexi bacterium]|nr:MFS transporter [Chloroflexota bacterium]MYD47544.1 MFS transporter [Chloroflexota bacterium]